MRPWLYSTLYQLRVAPWDSELRREIVALADSGRVSPDQHPTVLDLGCGTGRESVFLAQRGFTVTGVDYTEFAVHRARRRAREAGVADRATFVHADLTAAQIPGLRPSYDLLIDFGTLDDLRGEDRLAMAATIHRLSRPGSLFLLWCFYGDTKDFPKARWGAPSKALMAIAPGEEKELFGEAFDMERLPEPPPPQHCACFLMVRR